MSNHPLHQQYALQDPHPRVYKMDLQLPPPPRSSQSTPSFTTRPLSQPQVQQSPLQQPQQPPQQSQIRQQNPPPNSKTQEEWLQNCGHPNLQSFLEYYGFDPRDANEIAEGRNFLLQIRRQEQEQWEERQARPQSQSLSQPQPLRQHSQPPQQQQQSQAARKPTGTPVLTRRITSSGSGSAGGEDAYTRSTTPTSMNIYGLRPFEMEEAERLGRLNSINTSIQQTHHQQQQQQQQPKNGDGALPPPPGGHSTHLTSSPHHSHAHVSPHMNATSIPRSVVGGGGVGGGLMAMGDAGGRFHRQNGQSQQHQILTDSVLNAYGIKPWEF